MLDLSAAVALSVLPGALGANLLRAFLARSPAAAAVRLPPRRRARRGVSRPGRGRRWRGPRAAAAPLVDDLAAGRRRALVFGAPAIRRGWRRFPIRRRCSGSTARRPSLAQPVDRHRRLARRHAILARRRPDAGPRPRRLRLRGRQRPRPRRRRGGAPRRPRRGRDRRRPRLRARPHLSARARTARPGDCRERRDRFRAAAVGRAEAGTLPAPQPDHQRPGAGRGGRRGVAPRAARSSPRAAPPTRGGR